jgi:sulfoxide reductase heme-binding subunit YedZ
MSPSPPGSIEKIQAAVFVVCLAPLAWIFHGAIEGTLGEDPIETLQRWLGLWTFNFLLVTLAVTPLRRLTGWHWLARLRRMFGLVTFVHATMHGLAWLMLDLRFDWHAIASDIAKRPFIVAGFAAWLLMLPLAATSSNAMVRRLGGRRWQKLHRGIYAVAIIAAAHFVWQEVEDPARALVYAALVAVLLIVRALWRQQERQRQLDGAYGAPPASRPGQSVIKFHPRRK